MSGSALRRRRRALVAGSLAAATMVAFSGCGATPITSSRIETSVARTFANLWVHHEDEVGHPHPGAAALAAQASCQKGGPADPQSGAGTGWICRVTWLVDGPQTPVTASYTLNVQTDGCYTADGDGPASVNGSPTIVDGGGATRVNPLWAFNSCFDTT